MYIFSIPNLLENVNAEQKSTYSHWNIVSHLSLHFISDGGFNVVQISTLFVDAVILSKAIHQKSPDRNMKWICVNPIHLLLPLRKCEHIGSQLFIYFIAYSV